MVDTSRYFDNNLPEYDGTASLLDENKNLCGPVNVSINSFITSQLHRLQNVFRTPLDQRKFDFRDSSVYTGTSGVVLLVQKLLCTNSSEWSSCLTFHDTLLSKMSLEKRSLTFLCGDAGPLVVHILNCLAKGDEETVKEYVTELLKYAVWSKKKLDNEMLYGRAGYLYALLLVKQTKPDLIPDSVIQQIVHDLIDAGMLDARKKKCLLPLHYKWCDEEYVGAAHGYVGILYMILQAKITSPGSVGDQQEQIMIATIDALLSLRLPTGNLPPVVGEQDDRLMHWCHGAPGAIHLYALAYKLYKKPLYLSACKGFADIIWRRGLLKRGYGLCHGVAGNGYALLCMYQVTGEVEYLWRAVKFGEWCLSYGEHGCRIPDTPYSMFEGLAGTLYFLHDILSPQKARFPGFQLVPYG